ncbi:MAG: hypothetical protein JWO33_1831 [Caulobacteraceae bacterium]|nr:hypothetical protein [Caulobacteraceae bacterium]
MPPATLSAIETEQLRDLRSRLNRVAKGPLGDKSVGPLSKGFFDVCARVGLPGAGEAQIGRIAEADLATLNGVVASLRRLRDDPKAWRSHFDSGALQSVLTRRLVLGGREQA